jgi:hypothetical protein
MWASTVSTTAGWSVTWISTRPQRASWITPVPGGVGPMTVATLMENTLEAAEARIGRLSMAKTRVFHSVMIWRASRQGAYNSLFAAGLFACASSPRP